MGRRIKKISQETDSDDSYMSTSEPDKTNRIGKAKNFVKNVSRNPWWASLIFLTVAAFATRLSCLDVPPGTTWDEVHFGGFANKYINRTFYSDVHPPLGKILIAAGAYLTGYRAQFNFSEGTAYDDTIRYQLIRSEMASVGALIVPIAFLTVHEFMDSVGASFMAGLLVLCDTFVHKISVLIILDPLLNLAICLSVYCSIKFHGLRHREFSSDWWLWLILTGVSLGFVMSVKYIGVFTVCFVGLHTAYQLFLIACDKTKSFWYVIPHTLARALCLILLPLLIYLGGFILHILILSQINPGEGAWLHTRFLANLNNTEFDNKTFPKYVNYGSNVTIQTSTLHTGYLESWFNIFPSELTSACQVVSVMPLRDPEGTEWIMRRVDIENGTVYDPSDPKEPPLLVRNGDWMMLTHLGTDRSLRSHNRRAPYTKKLYQVCAYGDDRLGGPFETWQLVIPGVPLGEPLQLFAHDFKLKHYKMGCYLSASDVDLPKDWANEGSKEVACSRNPNYPTLLWHINWINTDKIVGETTAQEHKMDLWERIVHLHKSMFNINSGLVKADTERFDTSDSAPWMWPIAYQMQMLAGYTDVNAGNDTTQLVFSVASFNPVIVYVNIVALLGAVLLPIYHWYKVLRYEDELPTVINRRKKVLNACLWLGLAWATHYLPFFFMKRVLYLHHYCSSFLFSCMMTGILLDYAGEIISENVKRRWPKTSINRSHIIGIPAAGIIFSYVILYPMATYVTGRPFSTENSLSSYLNKFHLGQAWVEFGFHDLRYQHLLVHTSEIPTLEVKEDFSSPYLNASLYYETPLNVTKPNYVLEGEIRPMPASNFTILSNPDEDTGDIPETEANEETIEEKSEGDKNNNNNSDGKAKLS